MDLHPKQFARLCVRAVKGDGIDRVVERNFVVDPRTITLDRLRRLLARALDIQQEFVIVFHRSNDKSPVDLSCDWDLEGALAEEPCIHIVLELKPKEPGLDEWDIICAADVPDNDHLSYCQSRAGSFLEQIFHLTMPSHHAPLTEPEFLLVCDWPCPLRFAVYRAGRAEPPIRPALWMHLLDVFPPGAHQREREEFLNAKAEEYYGLRHSWQKLVRAGTIPPSLRDVTCLVRKDVSRTDSLVQLDERALYNVLTTYAVNHPSVGYCQGMSDLLSPLLHVMNTEALAYVAFCGLMLRMRDNFRHDGRCICTKFRHLRMALRIHDPQLHDHLSRVGALNLLFCYRWLLLDLKREFAYEEMLTLMEVLWSTQRPLHDSENGVQLYEVQYPTPSDGEWIKTRFNQVQQLVFTEDHFASSPKKRSISLKRWAIESRRQSIAQNIESSTDEETERENRINCHRKRRRRSRHFCRSWSGREESSRYILHRKELCYSNTVHEMQIDRWLNGESTTSSGRRHHGSSLDSNYEFNFSSDDEEQQSEEDGSSPARSRSEGYVSGQDSQQIFSTMTDRDSEIDEGSTSFFGDSSASADTYFRNDAIPLLPPPTRLGDGKPFLLFTCLVMILNHRDAIIANKMDANEIGIHFDRLVRKHRLADVLPKARELFVEYLRSGWTDDE